MLSSQMHKNVGICSILSSQMHSGTPCSIFLDKLFKMLPCKEEAGRKQPSRCQHDIAMELIQHEIRSALSNFLFSSMANAHAQGVARCACGPYIEYTPLGRTVCNRASPI